MRNFRSSASPFQSWRKPLREAMTWIPGGLFIMGSNDHYPEERPARRASVDGFWIDPTPMTMIGNTWEWTTDWWSTPDVGDGAPRRCAAKNPRGGIEETSCEADGLRVRRKVLTGGSHLCAPSYCKRYRPAARHAQPIDTSASHVGFRCIVRSRA